jgi:S-adenosylmethionine:tRNA ribosyltransferase-isomerase
MICLDPDTGAITHRRPQDLARELGPRDLVVVNDAATLPAALPARVGAAQGELRLVAPAETFGPDGAPGPGGEADPGRWWGVLFGAGDWREDTDRRAPPPRLAVGERLQLGRGADAVEARVEAVSDRSPRLVQVALPSGALGGGGLVAAAYRFGAPVQYSYHAQALPLDALQTAYAARPWAVEMPSAGRPLTLGVLLALHAAGVPVARLTHGAGLSATGDPALDAALPLPERFEVPPETASAVQATLRRGGRVVAVGTSVVRALEGVAAQHGGRVVAGPGVTDLVLDAGFVPQVVSGLLSGVHLDGESHHRLLLAFAEAPALAAALQAAAAARYANHEFGDALLILPAAPGVPRRGARRDDTSALECPAPAT